MILKLPAETINEKKKSSVAFHQPIYDTMYHMALTINDLIEAINAIEKGWKPGAMLCPSGHVKYYCQECVVAGLQGNPCIFSFENFDFRNKISDNAGCPLNRKPNWIKLCQ